MPEQSGRKNRGQVAPIFLTYEMNGDQPSLFDYSQDFYAEHTDPEHLEKQALPYGFGTISGLWQPDAEGKRTLPPQESIAFDARNPQEYVWDISHGKNGAQEVARLWVAKSGTSGIFARTDRQGSLLKTAAMTPSEAEAVERHLIERLKSPEVHAARQEMYDRRQSIRANLVKLVNERAADNIGFANWLGVKIEKVPPPRVYDRMIDAQHQQLATAGFVPTMAFNSKWFDIANT